jgi:hypothetical protein
VEATADDVVEAARSHPVERGRDHLERALVVVAEEKLQRRSCGELRRAPEAAERGLERRGDPSERLREQGRRQRLGRGCRARARAERSVDALRLTLDVVAALPPRLRDRTQELREARHSVTRLRWEVRTRVERSTRRRHEHGRRPPARPRHADRRLHRHRIDVRTFFAIDLHVHEQVVHERCGRGALERLVRHDVAPVARAVTDGDEQRLVLGTRSLERLFAPLVPVDRVPGVLQEVRGRRAGEAIHAV